MSDKKVKTVDGTKTDDMLIEMITPKVREIEEKFGRGEGLTQDDIDTLLLKSQYNHINGIENFWNQAKCYMRKFNGVPKTHLGLFLKKREWRFNNSDPISQLFQLRQWVREYLT